MAKLDLKAIQINYFRCKLLANPTNYSFKDKFLIDNDYSNSNRFIMKYSNTERVLLTQIIDWKRRQGFDKGVLIDPITPEDKSLLAAISCLLDKDKLTYIDAVGTIVFNNHLYMCEHAIDKMLGSGTYTRLISDPDTLQNLLLLLVLLKDTPETILPYIPLMYDTHNLNFKEYVNLNFFKNDLLNFVNNENDSTIRMFPKELWNMHTGCRKIVYAPKTPKSTIEEFELQSKTLMYQYFAEMFYIINNSKNHLQSQIYNLFTNYFITKETAPYIELIYKETDTGIKYSKFFKDIVNDHSPESRFNKIKNLNHNTEFSEALKDLNPYDLPYLFNELFTYMLDLSYRFIRLRTTSIILQICKAKKIPLDTPSDKSSLTEEEFEELKNVDIPEVKDSEFDLIDMHKDSLRIPLPPKEDTSKDKIVKNPTIDALDKEFSTFKDGKYSFHITNQIPSEVDVDTSLKIKYARIVDTVKLINKTLIKQIKDIKVYNTGGKNSGLNKGKLDKTALHKYKHSDKIFYNNTYKIKESDLAFGIILDVSGSMCGSGIRNGISTLIVLHETLKALGINHSIVTHESDRRYQCNIRRYQLFKEDKGYKITKNYNLTSIEALYGNCDSAALYYMEQAMSRVRNKDKIVIMFSDGQPTECTGSELKEQVQKMERKGIKVIGVGINYPQIADYYTDYANGNNLKEMLDIVANILKQYVLDKKD